MPAQMTVRDEFASEFSNLDAVLAADARAAESLLPPPDMLPSVWAEANVQIPIGNAKPGPIRFDNAPLQRGMLDVIKEPGIRRVDYMVAAQIGKTTVMQCMVGFNIAHEPKSQILAQPTEGDMDTFRETKLKPMLEANPKIARKMAKPRGREGVNNGRMVSYDGGWMMYSWAGSPKTARGRSAPFTLADEVDGYDVTPEGDFLELLAQRSATFDDGMDVRSSTPVELATSRIYKGGWLLGDQRRWYVRCPHCGHRQYFKWENVHWEGRRSKGIEDYALDLAADANHEPDTALYRCDDPECGTLWTDGERIAAIRRAESEGGGWIASKPFKGHASFHAPEMASTFRKLRAIVHSYLNKLALDDIQTFINVSLGWPYEAGDKADPDSLLARREEYAAPVPMGGLWLSIGVDMQMDRLEFEVVAWGFGEQSWSVHTGILWGDPLQSDVWDDLDDLLHGYYIHETGAKLPISAGIIDTGGTSGMTAAAYAWLQGKTGRRIFGGKGIAGWGRPIAVKPTRKQTGKNASKYADLVQIGVDEAKLVIQRRLALKVQGPGYCHFPKEDDWGAEYFKQLTAERLVTRYVKGAPVREWHKNDRDRNERLDCRVYAYAAMKLMQPSFKRIAQRLGVPLLVLGADGVHSPDEPADNPPQEKPMKMRKRTPPPPAPAPANDNPPPAAEIPQEAKPQQPANNQPMKKRPKLARRGGGWVKSW